MRHPLLHKKLNDQDFERRSQRLLGAHLLALLPLGSFALLVYGEFGRLPSVAVTVTCAIYVSVTAVQYGVVRGEVLRSLRREGVVDHDYRPPSF